MASLGVAAFSAALQEWYDEQKLTDLIAARSAFLGMVRKTSFLGKGSPLPMVTDPGQASMSGDFTTANTNRGGATYEEFTLTDHGKIFAIGDVERDLRDRAKAKAAFATVRADVDAKIKFCARELAHTIFRTENAVAGRIASISEGGGNTTIVVEDASDLRNLGKGANLVASATAAGALRDSGADYPVASIVYSTGTVVLTGTAATTSSWAVGDYLHREGSAPAGASPKYMSGLGDWIQGASVSATPWRGVDRSTNPELLAGIVLPIGSMSFREALIELTAYLHSGGGEPDVCLVNPLRFAKLAKELDSLATHEKVSAPGTSVSAQIGYDALRVSAGNGSVRIMSDPFCPFMKSYVLTMDSWQFLELGGERQPRLRKWDSGAVLVDQENADALKFQVEAKGDLGCTNPGANGVITF